MDCTLPGSSVHGILQARVLEWVAISFSRRSSRPKDRTWASCTVGGFLTTEPLGKPWNHVVSFKNKSLINLNLLGPRRGLVISTFLKIPGGLNL